MEAQLRTEAQFGVNKMCALQEAFLVGQISCGTSGDKLHVGVVGVTLQSRSDFTQLV